MTERPADRADPGPVDNSEIERQAKLQWLRALLADSISMEEAAAELLRGQFVERHAAHSPATEARRKARRDGGGA